MAMRPYDSSEQQPVAPTYFLTSIADFVDSITYRMLADGMVLPDVVAARAEVKEWSEWCSFWMRRAGAHEALGEEALARGYRLSAGEHFVRASLCAHYGQFLFFAFPEEKRRAVERKVRLYHRAAPLVHPPAQPLEIPSGKQELPAYLRVPVGDGPFPCAVLVGGLDAAKEDAHQFSDLCLRRGLATLAFDGPGQGESYYRGTLLGEGSSRSVSAAIDALARVGGIDSERIGVIGRSTGGSLAPYAAASDKRIKACVAWGAMYDLENFESIPPLVQEGFRFATGSADPRAAREAMRFINLAGVASRIACPLLVVHGGKDNITPPGNAERLIAETGGPSELRLFADSIHCNHDVAHIVRPEMADWLAAQLGAAPPLQATIPSKALERSSNSTDQESDATIPTAAAENV
jgi:2,6-dihydroxypseudooxynicotine hydrolase